MGTFQPQPILVTYLIDTNILIDHLRGDRVSTEFLLQIEQGQARASVSVITEYELLAVPRLSPHQAMRSPDCWR